MVMKVGITGASGFIGSQVSSLCAAKGHEPVAFSRRPAAGGRLLNLDATPDLSGLDAIVNLAGENLLGLWTADKKRRLRESRVLTTRRIVDAMRTMTKPPRILINGSAIGFYGDTGETLANETAPLGDGFLAALCRDWESEAIRAESLACRVVLIRIGFVLGSGGALKLIRPVFKLGAGGRLGNGRQWMSLIHVEDVAGMIVWAMENESIHGPLNAVMADPVRNSEFTRQLARAVSRPAVLPVPALALRLIFGELSRAMLDSSRVAPRVAGESGYPYRFTTLPAALADATR
jgi:uncharacterized protein